MTKPFKFNDQDRSNLDGADELEIDPVFVVESNYETTHYITQMKMNRRWHGFEQEPITLGSIEMSVENGVATVRVYIRKGAKVALIANGVKVNG